MIDYYLKATSRAALYDALVAAGMAEQTAVELSLVPGVNLDEIGVISQATDAVDADGASVLAPLTGYHANLRLLDLVGDASKLPAIDPPDTPMRMWATTDAPDAPTDPETE